MLTLLEASKDMSGDVMRQGVIETYAENSDILRVLPFINVDGGAYHYDVEATLPGVAFRGVNESYTESTGIINPMSEALRIGGGEVKVDNAIVRFHGEEKYAQQMRMKAKAASLLYTKKFVKGNSLVDPREFDGLQQRISGSQLINAAAATTNGGDPLSLIKLDEAIDAVDAPTHLLMSKAMRRRLTEAARSPTVGGEIDFMMDEFGRKVTLYDGLPILIADYDELGARILDFNEVGPGGATATATSIYVLSFGEDKVIGLQNGVMEVDNFGKLQASPHVAGRIEWYVGLAALHPRCCARVWGISNAAATA